MPDYTEREVRDELKRRGWGYDDAEHRVNAMLTQLADMLAEREKAVPVAVVKDSDALYTGWLSWTGEPAPPETKLYTHPAPSDAERLAEALRRTCRKMKTFSRTGALDGAVAVWVDEIESVLAAHSAKTQPQTDELHPATADLVDRFADALRDKLLAAQRKYGYSDNWQRSDWMNECRQHLREHLEKGDPRDVAAYCAFLWHHGESTAQAQPPAASVLDIETMVNRFLSWRLPKPWNPDNGISYTRPNYAHEPAEHDWPTGTNLFDAHQAREMIEYMLAAQPRVVNGFVFERVNMGRGDECYVGLSDGSLGTTITKNGHSEFDTAGQLLWRIADALLAAQPRVPDVDAMVTAFLGWKLPKDFAPGSGISFTPLPDALCWPVGTDLFTDPQARAMIEHMLAAQEGRSRE